MKNDKEGFPYPIINKALCVDCGLCDTVCPYSNQVKQNETKESFALQVKDRKELLDSSSGGAFILFAKWFIQNNGYVVGCVFDEDLQAKHIITNKIEDVEKMQGSKYVQSNIEGLYRRIKELLDSNFFVLFTGTPCQVFGLLLFLKKHYDNLLTIDLICHGVPSQKLLNSYILEEKNNNRVIKDIKFRDKKTNGWTAKGTCLVADKSFKISPFNNSYYNLYLGNFISRKTCYSCKFANYERVGDLTIGDCWNIQETQPKLDVSLGFSTLLINSQKGRSFFDKVKINSIYFDVDYKIIEKNNCNLYKSCEQPKERLIIYDYCEKYGYKKMAKKFCRYSKLSEFIRKLVPKRVKTKIKKLRKYK